MSHRIRIIVAIVATFAGLYATSPAHADLINEGGDTRHCATYAEAAGVYLGMDRQRVRRVLDTAGEEVSRRALDQTLAAAIQIDPDPYVSDVTKNREIRSYPTCADDGRPATFLVEFNTRTDRAVLTLWYWQGT